MSHHFKTFLLPTGRFALIVTGDGLEEHQRDVLNQFGDQIGAIATLVAVGADITVDDAIIDEDAVDTWDEPPKFAAGVFKPEVEIVPATIVENIDNAIFQRLREGATVSPAGLIKLTEEQKAEGGFGLSKEKLEQPVEPEVTLQGVLSDLWRDTDFVGLKGTRRPFGRRTEDHEHESVIVTGSSGGEEQPSRFQIGDRVQVNSQASFYRGRTGTVTEAGESSWSSVRVELDGDENPVVTVGLWPHKLDALELPGVEQTTPEFWVGDRVTVVGDPTYAGKNGVVTAPFNGHFLEIEVDDIPNSRMAVLPQYLQHRTVELAGEDANCFCYPDASKADIEIVKQYGRCTTCPAMKKE